MNKFGDPSQKVASKAIYCLSQLLFVHPNMHDVVLGEVEKLLYRSNVATRAQYYGLCFLSQFCLNRERPEIARRLIEVYFSFFKACVKKVLGVALRVQISFLDVIVCCFYQGEVDTRMMSALLMGVNRAYPYAKLEMEKVSKYIDTMYRVVHVASFNVGLHALSLLYQISDSSDHVSDRSVN